MAATSTRSFVPTRNVIVDRIAAAETVSDEYAEIVFADGQTAGLDLTDPRSAGRLAALNQMQAAGQAVYAETDPDTSVIIELLPPLVVTVGQLTPGPHAIDVELIISQTRHTLRRDNHDFERLLAALQQARLSHTTVLVTESTTEHEIIDVRPDPHPPPPDEIAEPSEFPVSARRSHWTRPMRPSLSSTVTPPARPIRSRRTSRSPTRTISAGQGHTRCTGS
jgi:hypothetical protein